MDATHYQHSNTINEAPLKGEISVLFSGEGTPREGHFIGPAVHDYYLIHVVLYGEGTFETLGETHKLGAGDAFVIFPDILVKYQASMEQPWKYIWIGFSGELVELALSEVGITPDHAVIRGCRLSWMQRRYKRLRAALEGNQKPALGNLEASGWLRIILYELSKTMWGERVSEQSTESDQEQRSHPLPYRRIDQAIRLMTLQYAHPLTIDGIARTVSYHRSHLTRLFKETTGMSPMQFLFKVRMKKAEELLEGDLTIAQIASSVGYNDPLFFTKQFRKWNGMSPTEYRREKYNKHAY